MISVPYRFDSLAASAARSASEGSSDSRHHAQKDFRSANGAPLAFAADPVTVGVTNQHRQRESTGPVPSASGLNPSCGRGGSQS